MASSAAITDDITRSIVGEKFGLFYPQKGIIILNADVIDTHVGFHLRDVGVDTVGMSTWDYKATPISNTLGENLWSQNAH